MSIHPSDVELLEMLLTVVGERRMRMGQSSEAKKRQMQNLAETGRRLLAREQEADMRCLQRMERELISLKSELEAVIEDHHGANWREPNVS